MVILSGSEPDRLFRNLAPGTEGWRHFFELDRASMPPYVGMPISRAAIEGCPGRSPGLLVVAVREHFDELTAKLRRQDWMAASREAGLLGHYLADAAMPFHATRNFDGFETGNRGIHRFLEVTLFRRRRERFEDCLTALASASRPLASSPHTPEAIALGLLRGSIRKVPLLLGIDCRAGATSSGGRRLEIMEEAIPVLCGSMLAASRAIARSWLLAWSEAGGDRRAEVLRGEAGLTMSGPATQRIGRR